MEKEPIISKIVKAREEIEIGEIYSSALIAGSVLEDIVNLFLIENINHLKPTIREKVINSMTFYGQENKNESLGVLANIFSNFGLLNKIGRAVKKSTMILKGIDLSVCNNIWNNAKHRKIIPTPNQAKLLIMAIENFQTFMGIDSDDGFQDLPFKISDINECLYRLLRKIWLYPDRGGAKESWAVKESDIIRCNLNNAIRQPGLGITLFTTELAARVFGECAKTRIENCIQWGFCRTQHQKPFLFLEEYEERINGEIFKKGDFRHTIALAILMARYNFHENQQDNYLKIILENQLKCGGWPSTVDENHDNMKANLPSTSYAVEFLSTYSNRRSNKSNMLKKALNSGQKWLIDFFAKEGAWKVDIFQNESWSSSWSNSYLLIRFITGNLQSGELKKSMSKCAEKIFSSTHDLTIRDYRLLFIIESRIAAAISESIRVGLLPRDLSTRAESWLLCWEKRFMQTLRKIPAKECDLATSSFAAIALLRKKNARKLGRLILRKLQ